MRYAIALAAKEIKTQFGNLSVPATTFFTEPPPESATRYDAVAFDPSGILVYLSGVNRLVDAEEYRPKVAPPLIQVFSIFLWSDGVEVIDTHAWRGFVREGRAQAHCALQRHCRKALAPALAKAMRDKSLTIDAYGDSVTSMGDRYPDMHRKPNGAARDILGYFSRYPDDTKSLVPRTSNRIDGEVHVRAGWTWYLIRALERQGVRIKFRNWGVPGTAVNAEIKSGDNVACLGGLHPERTKYLLEDPGDIVVLGFGANDIGAPDIYQRYRRLIELIQKRGPRCFVVNSPPLNGSSKVRTYAQWVETNREITRAAFDAGAACAPLENLFAVGNEGAIGLSRRSYGAAAHPHHPGLTELRAIGEYLVDLAVTPPQERPASGTYRVISQIARAPGQWARRLTGATTSA